MEVSGKKKDSVESYSDCADEVDPQIYCNPCSKDGSRITAHSFCQDCMEHLCESCYNTHRKSAPCKNHVLLEKSQMPKTQSSGHLQVPHDLTQHCLLHKGKLIEYICHDHNVLGCSPCITLNHRYCKIDHIPDVSKEYRTSDEYRDFVQSLAALQKQFKTIIEETKANKKKIMQNKSIVKDEIRKFRQEIDNMFDNLETSLMKHVDDILSDETARIKSLTSKSIKLEKDIEQLQNEISKLERANKTNALYIHSKANKVIVQKFTSAEKEAHEENYINNYVFTPNLHFKEILGSKAGIGELQRIKIRGPRRKSFITDAASFETLKIKYTDDIDVQTSSDKLNCCISGAVVITDDTVAVVDHNNCAVKIVDTKIKKIIAEKRLHDCPECLELIPENKLAFTIPYKRTITFLSIQNGLSEVRRLKVDGRCRDLVFHDNKLIVSFEMPGKVQIMDLDGHVCQAVEKDFYGDELTFPYVTFGIKSSIYISDKSKSTITSMNLNGEVLKGYKDERLLAPCGMVVLDDGSILVCSSRNNSVILISENLQKSRVILDKDDGLLCPWSLALDREKNKLYVGSGQFCKFLKVYDLN
ncbi:uncharacterized protein LOC132717702 [Ruditapes philippinarum]|uniref:uncharacterized protein LOC132717702 n=1 Tax=Ruditapes philippinarum TaxID=129788 RepID=UPI00295B8D66|nr:uncharacterized protein LOC132717702 [Ruditapes philippinarum]